MERMMFMVWITTMEWEVLPAPVYRRDRRMVNIDSLDWTVTLWSKINSKDAGYSNERVDFKLSDARSINDGV